MSDAPQGADWWIASDGKYYPPEQRSPGVPTAPSPSASPSGSSIYLKAGLFGGAALLAVLVLVVGCVAVFGGDDDVDEVTTTTLALEEPPPWVLANGEPPEKGTFEAPLAFGQAHDIGNGWTVKIAEFNPDAAAAIAAALSLDSLSVPGETFVMFRPEVTNNGADTRVFYDLQFAVVGASGMSYSSGFCIPPTPGWTMFPSEVLAGATRTGNICMAVPTAEASSLVVTVQPFHAPLESRTFLAVS